MSKMNADIKIKTCQSMITRILVLIGFFGSGFAATVGFYDFIVNAFNKDIANFVIFLEFLNLVILTGFIIGKIIKIEKINLEERDNE